MDYQHPIRNAEIHTFERADVQDNGARWVARFWPYNTWLIIFNGDTEEAAHSEAEAFRADVIEKNEAAFVNRAEGREKARKARELKTLVAK